MTIEPNGVNRTNQEADTEKLRQEIQGTSVPLGSNRGAWVTLHLHFPSGQEKTVLGFLAGSDGGQYKLTKFVLEREVVTLEQEDGIETSVHNGVWLINPMYVWMVEHEREAPRAQFRPYSNFPYLRT